MNAKKYIRSQSKASKPITIDDLICKDCIFSNPDLPTAYCNMYRPGESYKPASALTGNSCPSFRRKVNV